METMLARCSCGSVELQARGKPMATVVCYCDTCQAGSQQLEALPNGRAVRDPDGGTAYVSFRKDRVSWSKGADLLRDLKLEEGAATARVFASCCDTPMIMRFEDIRHWVPVYRARFADPPPVKFRICTNFLEDTSRIPNDVQSHAMYPPGLMGRLLSSRIGMLLRT